MAEPTNRSDLVSLLVGAVAALGATVALAWSDDKPFERLFGPAPPALVVVASTAAGVYALRVLAQHGWPQLARATTTGRSLFRPIVAAVAFGAIVILVDAWLRFPEDINTEWPESVLFYLAIAFVAEVVFHLVPLALVVAARRRAGRAADKPWSTVVLVGSVEAVFQVVAALSDSEVALVVFVAIHLFAIGVFEIVTFRRSGFLAMFGFRLCYYTIWHIAWGQARLSLLF